MYLYFDNNGTLLETINDEALRQYNKGVNTINVFIEDRNAPDSGKIPSDIQALSYWFQLADGETINQNYAVTRNNANEFMTKTIPFDRNRDLKRFKYGKSYEFFVIEIPFGKISEASKDNTTIEFVTEGDVFKRGGLVLMTIQAGSEAQKWLSLERVAFTVENAVLLPDGPVNSSEFNWLLQQYVLDGANDYDSLIDKPITNQDLLKDGFVPVAGTYYRYVSSGSAYKNGMIYYYDGSKYIAISGSYNDLADAPDVSKMVTTDGEQSISGFKTFTNAEGVRSVYTYRAFKTAEDAENFVTGDATTQYGALNYSTLVLNKDADNQVQVKNTGVIKNKQGGVSCFLTLPTKEGTFALTSDIPTDAVTYTAQNLTTAQKTQARLNIGAGTGNGTVKSVKINGSTKSPDSAGLVDLGTISGGGGTTVESVGMYADTPYQLYNPYKTSGSANLKTAMFHCIGADDLSGVSEKRTGIDVGIYRSATGTRERIVSFTPSDKTTGVNLMDITIGVRGNTVYMSVQYRYDVQGTYEYGTYMTRGTNTTAISQDDYMYIEYTADGASSASFDIVMTSNIGE